MRSSAPGTLTTRKPEMGILSLLGAAAGILDKGLAWINKRQDQMDRQHAEQQGAQEQQNRDLNAQDEELRKDAEVYMRPSDTDTALDNLRRRAADRVRRAGSDKPDKGD